MLHCLLCCNLKTDAFCNGPRLCSLIIDAFLYISQFWHAAVSHIFVVWSSMSSALFHNSGILQCLAILQSIIDMFCGVLPFCSLIRCILQCLIIPALCIVSKFCNLIIDIFCSVSEFCSLISDDFCSVPQIWHSAELHNSAIWSSTRCAVSHDSVVWSWMRSALSPFSVIWSLMRSVVSRYCIVWSSTLLQWP